MLLVTLVLGPTSRASGLLAPFSTSAIRCLLGTISSGGGSTCLGAAVVQKACLVLLRKWGDGPNAEFHPSCNSSTIFYSPSHTIASSFQLNTSQVSTVKSLMLFLVSIGRNFDSWLQVLSEPQHQFLPSFCWNWSVFPRTAMSCFPYAWLSPILLQDLCNRSKEVLQILSCPTDE